MTPLCSGILRRKFQGLDVWPIVETHSLSAQERIQTAETSRWPQWCSAIYFSWVNWRLGSRQNHVHKETEAVHYWCGSAIFGYPHAIRESQRVRGDLQRTQSLSDRSCAQRTRSLPTTPLPTNNLSHIYDQQGRLRDTFYLHKMRRMLWNSMDNSHGSMLNAAKGINLRVIESLSWRAG